MQRDGRAFFIKEQFFQKVQKDGKTLAVLHSQEAVRLVRPESGQYFAALEFSQPGLNRAVECFSPDGSLLVTRLDGRRAIQVWDLRLIRRQLKEMTLDWDLPEYPPAPSSTDAMSPLRIQVLLGELNPEK